MNAARIARLLKAQGVAVQSVEEGDHDMDGQVNINDRVWVQVPTYGSGLEVTSANAEGTEFAHYGARKATDIAAIVADIRKALAA